MTTALWILTLAASLFCTVYVIMFALIAYGWLRTGSSRPGTAEGASVAVVVAARNEEETILKCLESLAAQDYRRVEFILVDDHSTDRTAEVITEFCNKDRRFRLFESEGEGKKKAIATGIRHTTAALILTTDADCTMGAGWIRQMAGCFTEGVKMIAGPVAFEQEITLFEKMQSLELMALAGSTGGALYFHQPVLCNGANLGYSREIFNELKGFEGIDSIASGDDVLLMYKIAAKYPKSVIFVKSRDAVVFTRAKKDLSSFMEQRKRWASKKPGMVNGATNALSFCVYFLCLSLLLMGILSGIAALNSAIGLHFLQICLILTGIKCVIDFLLLFLAASFFQKKRYLYLFLPVQFIYVLYVVVAGMLGSRQKYEWKGRRTN